MDQDETVEEQAIHMEEKRPMPSITDSERESRQSHEEEVAYWEHQRLQDDKDWEIDTAQSHDDHDF